jgi:hypothetical protein
MHASEDGTYPMLAVRKPNSKNTRKERIPLNKAGAVWNYLRFEATAGYRDHERMDPCAHLRFSTGGLCTKTGHSAYRLSALIPATRAAAAPAGVQAHPPAKTL